MPQSMIEAYLERLPARKAEWALLAMDATSLPHLKPRDQRTVLTNYERDLRGLQRPGRTVATDADLKALGIGVRYGRKSG